MALEPDYWEIVSPYLSFKALKTKQYGWFWPKVQSGEWEPETFVALQRMPAGCLYLDIGAWIGPTVFAASSRAGRIIAVEPDAVAMAELVKNLSLNPEIQSKVSLCNFAIAPEPQAIDLYAYNFGDSMTSLLPTRGAQKMTFLAMGVVDFIDRYLDDAKECFIKMDIEGSEYDVLPLLIDNLCDRGITAQIYLSLHGHFNFEHDKSISSWCSNVEKHGRLLKRAAEYGTIRQWDGTDWVPSSDASAFPNFLEIGGTSTTILITPDR